MARKAAQAMPQIFPAQTFRSVPAQASTRRGFSLLELMIVMGLMAGLVTMVLPRLAGRNNQMKQTVRRLSSLTRDLETTAKLQGVIYRLVLDLGLSGGKDTKQYYWVEKGSNQTVLSPDQMIALKEEDDERTDEEKKRPPEFSQDGKHTKGKVEFPSDLRVKSVEVRRIEAPITEGLAYIHFFPQGLADEAAIHLEGGPKLHWTLAVHPLTGKTHIVTEEIALKELSGQ
jgi:general secretion pathway protein H